MPTPRQKKYIPAVDGLRALGVLAVLFYHLRLPFAKSGLLGVTVFFVISGYLVTWIMRRELENDGRLDLRRFWKRRALRILPSMAVMILVMAIVYTIFNHFLLTKMRPDVLPSLALMNNWWQIFHEVSYFEAQGAPSPLTHCWSLAIEGQFYLLWPLLMLLIYKLPGKRKLAVAVSLIISGISIVMMAVMFDPLQDPSRVYYGTDTRCFSLLLGGFLALVEPKGRYLVNGGIARYLNLIGAASLLLIIVFMGWVNSYSTFLYRGGQAQTSVLTLLLLFAALQTETIWSKIFSFGPLVAIGKMSYSLYLWHYPIIILISGGRPASWRINILEIVLSLVAGTLSYFLIEKPFRDGALGKVYSRLRHGVEARSREAATPARIRSAKMATGVMVLLLMSSCVCMAVTPSSDEMPMTLAQKDSNKHAARQADKTAVQEDALPSMSPSQERQEIEEAVRNADILLIGDSVAADASPALEETFPNGIMDVEIGRQPGECADLYASYVEQGWDGDIFIYALATNGPVRDTMEVMRDRIGKDRPMFIITGRGPYDPWVPDNNKEIEKFAAEHAHTYVIDWFGYSEGHAEWLEPDETHLVPNGGAAYRDLVEQRLIEVFTTEEML